MSVNRPQGTRPGSRSTPGKNGDKSTQSPPTARQRQVLRLLYALGGSANNLDFQKHLFLYCQRGAAEPPYEFVPHRFGAFSFTSYSDRGKLALLGLITGSDQEWAITTEGRQLAAGETDMWLADYVERFGSLRGDDLVAETYRQFPYFATRSEIAARVLAGDREALANIEAERPIAGGSVVQTVGYEGRSLESYLNVLLRSGITLLCDVRRNPLSRKYGFSKTTLHRACRAVGISYEHLPELGIASEQRQNLRSQRDYDELFAEYENSHLPLQSAALETIHGWVKGGEKIALTCFERLPEQCHRHCVAEALEERFGERFRARHL